MSQTPVINLSPRVKSMKSSPELHVSNNDLESEMDACLIRMTKPAYCWQQRIKRLFDVLASIVLILFFAPMMIIIAILIKLTSPGPVFYKSLRFGKHEERFMMFKFRTMVQDAERLRSSLREKTNQKNQLFKMENDPRITSLGRFLRNYSLDEFPQLFNVLLGHMSLVGPRPFAPDDSAFFQYPYNFRFRVIPGMTGLWQVSGRSLLDFTQVCQLDMRYALDWNLGNDFIILLKTFSAVLNRTGSY